ncbi:MAG: rhomboid family intramembrane serine protease [Planctomycetes bacterium]|nr:rhomboid family intramembrane serine protease [Planctomycetota bacterium]
MIFPIGTDRPLQRPTLVNHLLVLINLFAFCIVVITTGMEGDLYDWVILTFGLSREHHEWWRFITYSLIHAGPMHLIGNLVTLWVFGPNVEDRFGRVGYLAFYFIGSAVAGLAHILSSGSLVIGASGAISAITGAFLVLFPRTVVRTFIFFFVIGLFNIPAMWFIFFAIARDALGAGMHGSNVSYAAHFGGYIYGFGVAIFLLTTHILAREDYDLFFMFKQMKRREEMRAAVRESQERIRGAETRPRGTAGPPVQVVEVPEVPLEIAQARAALSRAVSSNDRASLSTLYASLISAVESGRKARAELPASLDVLPRRAQLDLANRLFEIGDRAGAARAYRGFLTLYEKDPESGVVRVMLALLMVRYLEQQQQAKALLESALGLLKDKDEEHASLARSLLSEIESGGARGAGA